MFSPRARRRAVLPAVMVLVAAPLTACGTNAMDIAVGDCFDAEPMLGADEVETFDVVDCEEEHTGEVYGVYEHSGSDFPADEQELLYEAEEHCYYEYESFVGTLAENSAHEYYILLPSADSWENYDDRSSHCLLVSEPVSASLQGSGT